MKISVSSLAMIYTALDSLKAKRNVLIVAEPRTRAFVIARILVAIAKRREVVCANHRGADVSEPWVYARGAGERTKFLATYADVYQDLSAAMERQHVKPPKVRRVTP